MQHQNNCKHFKNIFWFFRHGFLGFFFYASKQVGIMLKGTVIDSMVVGGPAFNSSILEVGDIILGVDGSKVTDEIIVSTLLGDDRPDSKVVLAIQRPRDDVCGPCF
jgi:S1-C subfamily serine protease